MLGFIVKFVHLFIVIFNEAMEQFMNIGTGLQVCFSIQVCIDNLALFMLAQGDSICSASKSVNMSVISSPTKSSGILLDTGNIGCGVSDDGKARIGSVVSVDGRASLCLFASDAVGDTPSDTASPI